VKKVDSVDRYLTKIIKNQLTNAGFSGFLPNAKVLSRVNTLVTNTSICPIAAETCQSTMAASKGAESAHGGHRKIAFTLAPMARASHDF